MSEAQSTKVARTCAFCGSEFLAWLSRVKAGWAKYCSAACYRESRGPALADRFFRHIGRKTPGGCILWAGRVDKDGYGVIASDKRRGSKIHASRVAYELLRSPVPPGLLVLHSCDNPPCINPAHLFLGTHADNTADKMAKGRGVVGERVHTAKLTEGQVREIRRRYALGGVTQQALAGEFKVVQTVIGRIIHKQLWKELR